MTVTEMKAAVEQIMECDDVVIKPQHCTNWISLYTVLARIAKGRLSNGEDYSTEMPIGHIYMYSKNLNQWAADTLNITKCIGHDTEIEAFYGGHTEEFQLDRTDYETVRSMMENSQPHITAYFKT
jgi:hypothetical protein